jgi:nicotinate-nucleotide adenylyltransferase
VATGILGGSFDPVHHGHLIVAGRAAEALGLDTVFFVPCRQQPLKPAGPAADGKDRAAMIRLAIEGDTRFALDTQELERPAPSYTVETLRAIRARWPDERLVLLVGADAAAQLHRWRAADEVARLAEVAVLARPGSAAVSSAFVTHTVATPAIEISASDIRARVLGGRSVRYLVPEKVAGYIEKKQLYR